MTLRYEIRKAILLASFCLLVACQGEPAADAEPLTAMPGSQVFESSGKPETVPVNLKYRLLETPRVGQPFDVELTVVSSVDTPSLGFDVGTENGLHVDARTATYSVSSKPANAPETAVVSVTPTHEGRFHLHVTCNVMVGGRMLTRIVPIAIQVGQGTRAVGQMGEIRTDADGNDVISLPAEIHEVN